LKSIQKRRPALEKLIRRYNQYCESLKAIYKPEYQIPLPQPLAENLYEVCDDSYLLEGVIIGQTPEPPARWFTESTVCLGVRALLKLDRCVEEKDRLLTEAGNMCNWFCRELTVLELSLLDPGSTFTVVTLGVTLNLVFRYPPCTPS
jgi:hypothetical protein